MSKKVLTPTRPIHPIHIDPTLPKEYRDEKDGPHYEVDKKGPIATIPDKSNDLIPGQSLIPDLPEP